MLVKMQALCKDGADYSDKVYISNSALAMRMLKP